jgi:hypothetical protein
MRPGGDNPDHTYSPSRKYGVQASFCSSAHRLKPALRTFWIACYHDSIRVSQKPRNACLAVRVLPPICLSTAFWMGKSGFSTIWIQGVRLFRPLAASWASLCPAAAIRTLLDLGTAVQILDRAPDEPARPWRGCRRPTPGPQVLVERGLTPIHKAPHACGIRCRPRRARMRLACAPLLRHARIDHTRPARR